MLENLFPVIKEQVLEKKWALRAGVGLIAFGAGAGIGYILGSKKYQVLTEKLEDAVDTVVDALTEDPSQEEAEYLKEVKDYLESLDVDEDGFDEDGWRVVGELSEDGEVIYDEDYKGVRDKNGEPEVIDPLEALPKPDPKMIVVEEQPNDEVVNVFTGSDPDWSYEEELEYRKTHPIYVLHKDEFWNDENEWAQLTVTYFAKDDIMVDSSDVPIYNYEGIVGPLRFGHGSNDPGVFFVRNETLEAEYEVLLDRGSYEEEILGNYDEFKDDEIKHSRKRKLQDE